MLYAFYFCVTECLKMDASAEYFYLNQNTSTKTRVTLNKHVKTSMKYAQNNNAELCYMSKSAIQTYLKTLLMPIKPNRESDFDFYIHTHISMYLLPLEEALFRYKLYSHKQSDEMWIVQMFGA